MAGIAVGVAVMIIVLSVMNGFQKDVTERLLSVFSHIEIYDARGDMTAWDQTAARAMTNRNVRAVAPFVESQAMLISDDLMQPTILRGVLPGPESRVSDVVGHIRAGNFQLLAAGASNIVLGIGLARDLGLKIGDKVSLAVAQNRPGGEELLPRTQVFTLVAIFEVGHNQFDSGLAYIHLDDAQRLLGQTGVTGLRVRISEMHQAPEVAHALQELLGSTMAVRDWTTLNASWFAAIEAEKHMMFLILAMIIVVAASNLVSTLVMTVRDKHADIAILRTMGASPGSIMLIFVIQGGLVGMIGTGFGVGCGTLVALHMDVIAPMIESLLGMHFLSKEIYFISVVPSDLRLADIAQTATAALILALLSTLYPSWRAARVEPAETLRHE